MRGRFLAGLIAMFGHAITLAGGQLPSIAPAGIVESTGLTGDIAPGSVILISGKDFAAAETTVTTSSWPATLAGVSLEVFDGVNTLQAPLHYVSATLIEALMPYEIVGLSVTVRVINSFGASSPQPLSLASQAPKIMTWGNDKGGPAMITHADGSAVSAASPARPDEILTIYARGLGAVVPPIASGSAAGDSGANPNRVVVIPAVLLGDRVAVVLHAELVTDSVGMYRIAVQMPGEMSAGQPDVSIRSDSSQGQSVSWLYATRPSDSPEFYVAPAGTPGAAGTRADPWDIATALSQPPGVEAGATIWLLTGTYGSGATYFISQLTGTSDKPIVVRQLPGERATLNGSLVVNGANAWYWGFEITSSFTDRSGDQFNPAAGTLDAVDAEGPNTKFINLVVHDTRNGLGLWTPAEGAEAYGCIIYNVGWQGPDRGHGHGIYTQNRNATKHIGDNIIFNQFGLGIQAYGSNKAFVQNYVVDHNIVFNNGSLSKDGRTDNILFGIGVPMSGIDVENNYTYHTPEANIGTSRMGWSFGAINRDVVIKNNYFVGGYFAVEVWNWSNAVFTGNTTYSSQSANAALQTDRSQSASAYLWDQNRYYGTGQFYFMGQQKNWTSWRDSSKLDQNSAFVPGRPTASWVFTNANRFEPGRGNIAIYNWDASSTVDVDVSSILPAGTPFEVRNAQDYFSPPVLRGTYAGGTIRLPLSALTVAQPNGGAPNAPKWTEPGFGAFVILAH